MLSRMGVRAPYLLAVGHFYRHKNFVELVTGFSRALESLPRNVQLVIAGQESDADYAKEVGRAIASESLGDRVVLTGAVAYADLPPLYANASMFVFPSSCESFPNTLIEGMASGAPTLSSRRGPMVEIAGDGAEYFSPSCPDEIARGIVRLWQDRAFAQELASRGMERVSRYSWTQTARRLGLVLQAAAV
jgi:glycosyltransferase involved in cell wall biosynthesis